MGRALELAIDDRSAVGRGSVRIAKTVEFIAATVELCFRTVNAVISGYVYLPQILLTDFCFHFTATHGILRHSGLTISKVDHPGEPH